jgi:hypothetical protein
VSDLSSVFAQAMSRPTIISDIDGVLANYVSAACEAVNGHFATQYTPMAWWSYRGPFSADEYDWLVSERFGDGAFWMAESPHYDAIAALGALGAQGYHLIISSEAPAEQRSARVAWLEHYEVPYNELYLVGPGGKAELCAGFDAEHPAVLIDDNPARWVDCAHEGIEILCPRTPYCPVIASEPNVTIFDRFSEVPSLVAALRP